MANEQFDLIAVQQRDFWEAVVRESDDRDIRGLSPSIPGLAGINAREVSANAWFLYWNQYCPVGSRR